MMNAESLLVLASDVITNCNQVPIPKSVITDGVNIIPTPDTTSFHCTTMAALPSLWVQLAPLLALAAALYGILAAVGDYLEFRDKNLKERRSSSEANKLTPVREIDGLSKLRMGQRVQVAAKASSGYATVFFVGAFYHDQGALLANPSPDDLALHSFMFNITLWGAIGLTIMAGIVVGVGRSSRITEAEALQKEAMETAALQAKEAAEAAALKAKEAEEAEEAASLKGQEAPTVASPGDSASKPKPWSPLRTLINRLRHRTTSDAADISED
ncbi:hypothetical protein ACIPYU_19895 [Paenarthrobacter nicotinovorans]|uniref:hypothetical protein n=1 Tax=Paenarthrobacter nicotinovorans TaxID=29320 RepID=UPI003808AF20